MTVDERARAGLFLAMQYPVEVPGVTVSNFLRTAKTAIDGEAPKLRTWVKDVRAAMERAAHGPGRSPSATSTRASPAARRSATRSSSWSCSSRRSRSSTRPTPASTSTRCSRLRGRQPGPRDRRGRRPAHHALHADPALHQARLRARLRRRPHRRGGRPRARRPARGRGLRPVHRRHRCRGRAGRGLTLTATATWTARAAGAVRRRELERIRADFPMLAAARCDGTPLVYLDSAAHLAEAARGPRRRAGVPTRRHNAAVHRGAHQLAEEATEPSRRRARRSRRSSGVADDELAWTRTPPRGSTSSPTRPRPTAERRARARPGRRGRRHRDGAPREPRAVAGARARTGATLRWIPRHRRGPPRPRRRRRIIGDRARECWRSRTCRTCSAL